MKKISILLLVGWIVLISKAQFLTPLGNGLNQEIICSAFDSKGRLTVGCSKGYDSTQFKTFDPTSGKWTLIHTMSNPYQRWVMKCAYKNDSLFVNGWSSITPYWPNAIYHVENGKATEVLRCKSGNLDGAIFGIQVIRNKLIVLGYYDSLLGNNNRIKVSHAAAWDGQYCNNINYSLPASFNYYDVVSIGDTLLTLGSDQRVYQFVYPNTWSKISNQLFSFISRVNNKFLLTREGSDSLIYWSSGKFERRKGNMVINYRFKLAGNKKGYAALNPTGYMYQFDPSAGTFTPVLKHSNTWDSSTVNFAANDTHLYFHKPHLITYKNVIQGNIAEINLDSAEAFTFDTIVVFPYWDRNKNATYDAGDTLIDFGYAQNLTYNNYVYAQNKVIWEVIPDYNDAEYAIPYWANHTVFSDTCFKLPFSGNVKSKNTNPGITRDTVFFPYQRTSLQNRNLVLYNYSATRARIESNNSYLGFNITNKDCDLQNSSAKLYVVLHPNTTLLGASPAATTTSGDTVIFELKNLAPERYHGVYLQVKYKSTYFNLNDTVSHKAWITTTFAEYTGDNKVEFKQVLSYSYDPNRKYSTPEGVITADLKTVNYHIDFENEGNDYAERVIVIDTLDTKIPVYEFQMNGASHPYNVYIRENVVTWVFENIMLQPKAKDSIKSKGFISFHAKVKGSLRQGDSIRNRASIYFDMNKPIVTNFAVINRAKPDSIPGIAPVMEAKTTGLRGFPNPAENEITLQNLFVQEQQVVIYDILGNTMWRGTLPAGADKVVQTGGWAKGLYIAKSDSGDALKFLLQ